MMVAVFYQHRCSKEIFLQQLQVSSKFLTDIEILMFRVFIAEER